MRSQRRCLAFGRLLVSRPTLIASTVLVPLAAFAIDVRAGGLSFSADLSFETGREPRAVAMGDLNGDRTLDLVTVNYGDSTVSILLGRGDGSFAPRTDYPCGRYPRSLAIADLDRDGDSDLVVANHQGSGAVAVLMGNGDGTFGPATSHATGIGPSSVAVGDLDRDGSPDIAASNSPNDPYGRDDGTVSILRGNGDGSFAAKTDLSVGDHPGSVTLADLSGDGRLDLVVTSVVEWPYPRNNLSVLLGDGQGAFMERRDFVIGSQPHAPAIGDLDLDGMPDLAISTGYYYGTIAVVLGHGNGSFTSMREFATGHGFFSLAIGDLNLDGKPDLAVTHSYYHDSVSVLLGYGNGRFEAPLHFATGAQPLSLAIGDLDGDGKPDLATANHGSNTITVLLNRTLDLPGIAIPPRFELLGAWPNPTPGTADIHWAVRAECTVDVSLLDCAGRRVRSLLVGVRSTPGHYRIAWDGRGDHGERLRAGMYLVEVRAGAEARIGKLVLVP